MNSIEREQVWKQELKTELRSAIEDAVIGERLDDSLVGRVKTVARAILLRHRLAKAQIHVSCNKEGLSIQIILPEKGPRVGMIQLSFGGDDFAGI